MRLKILFGLVLVLSLVGCAASRREMVDIKSQQLEMRIRQLEGDIQQKDKKLSQLENELELARSGSKKAQEVKIYPEKKVVAIKKEVDIPDVTPKKIQTALKKAGFYNGQVDGNIGENTKKAIKEFQKGNGLKVDGIVGKRTWLELCKY